MAEVTDQKKKKKHSKNIPNATIKSPTFPYSLESTTYAQSNTIYNEYEAKSRVQSSWK